MSQFGNGPELALGQRSMRRLVSMTEVMSTYSVGTKPMPAMLSM
jgi:hypothetical protein